MEITLKNLKISKFMSEETTCFQATIYVDGKIAGTAQNDGHGGSTYCHLDPKYHDLITKKFTIPCYCDGHEKDCFLCKGTGTFEDGLDGYIDHLVETTQKEKERTAFTKKLLKNGMNYMIVTQGQYIGIKAPDEAQVRAYMAKKYPTRKIKEIVKVGE